MCERRRGPECTGSAALWGGSSPSYLRRPPFCRGTTTVQLLPTFQVGPYASPSIIPRAPNSLVQS